MLKMKKKIVLINNVKKEKQTLLQEPANLNLCTNLQISINNGSKSRLKMKKIYQFIKKKKIKSRIQNKKNNYNLRLTFAIKRHQPFNIGQQKEIKLKDNKQKLKMIWHISKNHNHKMNLKKSSRLQKISQNHQKKLKKIMKKKKKN